jgi:hypothetical protein
LGRSCFSIDVDAITLRNRIVALCRHNGSEFPAGLQSRIWLFGVFFIYSCDLLSVLLSWHLANSRSYIEGGAARLLLFGRYGSKKGRNMQKSAQSELIFGGNLLFLSRKSKTR